jgi:hypothetical protein
MRHSATALIVLSALLGSTAIPAHAEDQPTQQNNAAPAAETSTSSAPNQAQGENRKDSGTNDQSGPSSAAPTTSQDSQGDKATHSVSGRGGKEEPGSHVPTQAQGEATPVFVNGALNVPGAPADSQTVPAKFSKRNDAIDKLPILGMSLGLSDAQKRSIVESVRGANVPVAASTAKISDELAMNVVVHDLLASANDPAMAKLKYVRLSDRVLLVEPNNRIVIGVIQN